MGIEERYRRVAQQVAQTAREAGRDPGEVRLVAVSKTGVEAALAAGARDFGENRPDAIKKKAGEYPQARWHFIGNVQSRRIPDIVQCASLVHSLYQERHVARIDEAARRLGKVQDVLLEVNVSGEESKSGVAPGQAGALLRACEPFANVRVRGLMTMAPQGDKAVAHACFEDLARLHARLRDGGLPPSAREKRKAPVDTHVVELTESTRTRPPRWRPNVPGPDTACPSTSVNA